ncbi:hypothetical protein KUCAC02_016519 [Chaenocephalus aceratus]|nr:hypothetical protein KUCAC02_016519 [Chaenocephalus aceratus]
MGQWINWMMLQCGFLRLLTSMSPEDENPILKDKDGPSETGTPPCRKHSLPPSSTPLKKKCPKMTLQLPSPPDFHSSRSGRRMPNYTADKRSSMVIRSPNSHQGAKKQLVKALHVDKDSLQAQARPFKTLHEMYKNKKQNKDAVSQLLDLEFEARRLFIDSDVLKVEDRHTKVMSELRRILDKDKHK